MVSEQYDICIIGGGPAAFSSAINFAQNNLKVALVHRNEQMYKKLEYGETLSFKVSPYLSKLNVLDNFEELDLPILSRSVSTWGSDNVSITSSLLNPSGLGWHFNRSKFDSLLYLKAIELKVNIFEGNLLNSDRINGKWQNKFSINQMPIEIKSEFQLIATGRGMPKAIKTQETGVLDKLVGFIIIIPNNDIEEDVIRIDAFENGWFYSTISTHPIHKYRVLSYFTDGDLLKINKESNFIEFLRNTVSKLPSISSVVNSSSLDKAIAFYKVSANSTFKKSFLQNETFFCGDSAQTYDPLSSQGITFTINDSIKMSNALLSFVGGCSEALKLHEISRRNEYFDYIKYRFSLYSLEKRWSNNLFWRRRQTLNNIYSFIDKL